MSKSFLLLVNLMTILLLSLATNAFSSSRARSTTWKCSMKMEQFTGPSYNTESTSTIGSIELEELGLVLSIAESTVVTGTMGLFARISDHVDETTLPAMSLLAGYAKGTFQYQDEGDKTVGFLLSSMDMPVFLNRQLMTMEQAVASVIVTTGTTEEVKIAGHELYYDEEQQTMVVLPTMEPPFARYFVPNNHDDIHVSNFGQYCNDRAFVRGMDQQEYHDRCATENCVRLAWRIEYDEQTNMLQPSWPVSILSRDMRFCNRELMELGTTYGWNYWDATIQLDRL